MVRKIQRKFIITTAISIIFALTFILGGVNILSYNNTYRYIDSILEMIVNNDGVMPSYSPQESTQKNSFAYRLTPESYYEIRYFSLILDDDNNILKYYDQHIASVDTTDLNSFLDMVNDNYSLIDRVFNSPNDEGLIKCHGQRYSYKVNNNYIYNNHKYTLMVFLNCTQRIEQTQRFLNSSMIIGFTALIVFLITEIILSRHAINPIIRNYEKQKQFITNAGHELKTPLSVISANTEVLEMMNGKNEWTESTVNQVKRLNMLISDLISLARSDEMNVEMDENINFSDISKEASENFKTVSSQQNKKIEYDIEPDIMVKGNSKLLTELPSIFIDNACKYCDDGGKINISLKSDGKNMVFICANDFTSDKKVDVGRFFERFYRSDESHNNKKSGYGIGLSMANSIVKAHKGKISASYKNNIIKFKIILKKEKKSK